MPFQAPSWTEFYTCPICANEFSNDQRLPVSLGCGHTICRICLATVYNRQCPFDQTAISTDVDNLPINNALLQLLNLTSNEIAAAKDEGLQNDNFNVQQQQQQQQTASFSSSTQKTRINEPSPSSSEIKDEHLQPLPPSVRKLCPENLKSYKSSKKCIEELAQYLKSFVTNTGSLLTRPMLRKLVTLVNCQLMEEEGRIRAVRTARFLGERTIIELLLQHQNPQLLSQCLWAAVRSRGCQFLGPAMQEEVLNLVLQALQNGSALSRKVLVMYVVQRLVQNLIPASKTSIGHVVQLLYRASCFKVSKREGDSSLMQLKEEFRNYEALRREHDAQIVQIATEAGLRIAPDQWSSLLYGSLAYKSHMQSICDSLQTPSSFAQSVQEFGFALQRTGDPTNLTVIRPHLKHLASIDPSTESPAPSWQDLEKALDAVRHVVLGLVEFMQYISNRKFQDHPMPTASANANGRYKISLCRDLADRRMCPRGPNCTFAHSTEERNRYRAKQRRQVPATGKAQLNRATTTASSSSGNAVTNESAPGSSMHASDNNKNQQQYSTNNPSGHRPAQITPYHTSPDLLNSPERNKPSSNKQQQQQQQYGISMDNGYNGAKDNNSSSNNLACANLSELPFGTNDTLSSSPLHMQTTMKPMHASPIPQQPQFQQGPPPHILGMHAPTPLMNAPHHQQNFSDKMSFSTLNYHPNMSGKFVRMPPNMSAMSPLPLPPTPPNIRHPNLRGPITAAAPTGNKQVIQPRSPMHQNYNMNIATVLNPPTNLQGTNSQKHPQSPLNKNQYKTFMNVDYYNTPGNSSMGMGVKSSSPSFFGNPNMDNNQALISANNINNNNSSMSMMGTAAGVEFGPMLLQKGKQQKPPQPAHINAMSNSMWNSQLQQQQQQQQCQPLRNPNDFGLKQQQHQQQQQQQQQPQLPSAIFLPSKNMQQLPTAIPQLDNTFYDEKSMDFNKLANNQLPGNSAVPTDNSLLADNYIFNSGYNNNGNNTILPQLNSSTPSKTAAAATAAQDRQNSFWHQLNNQSNVAMLNTNSAAANNQTGPSSSPSLYRDRESFVRSDSILDDDAATYVDIPSSSSATALGNKFGPICPMYKGSSLTSASEAGGTLNNETSFINSWNAFIHPAEQDSASELLLPTSSSSSTDKNNHNNIEEFSSVFSNDAGAAIAASGSIKDGDFNDFVCMEDGLTNLKLSNFQFDLKQFDDIFLGERNYQDDIKKNSENILWNNSGDIKSSTSNLGLNSFWNNNNNNNNNTPAAAAAAAVSGITTTQALLGSNCNNNNNNNSNRYDQQQQQQTLQQNHISSKADDTELDITDIVGNIWPCDDDSGIKLE